MSGSARHSEGQNKFSARHLKGTQKAPKRHSLVLKLRGAILAPLGTDRHEIIFLTCQSKSINNFIIRKATELEDSQQKLNFSIIMSQVKKSLDLEFAKVCYVQALPFNVYESEVMQDALHKLNSAYKPPIRKSIAESLLDSTFESLKVKVEAIIASLDHINCISNENTNINASRIFNTCIRIPNDALYWSS